MQGVDDRDRPFPFLPPRAPGWRDEALDSGGRRRVRAHLSHARASLQIGSHASILSLLRTYQAPIFVVGSRWLRSVFERPIFMPVANLASPTTRGKRDEPTLPSPTNAFLGWWKRWAFITGFRCNPQLAQRIAAEKIRKERPKMKLGKT